MIITKQRNELVKNEIDKKKQEKMKSKMRLRARERERMKTKLEHLRYLRDKRVQQTNV